MNVLVATSIEQPRTDSNFGQTHKKTKENKPQKPLRSLTFLPSEISTHDEAVYQEKTLQPDFAFCHWRHASIRTYYEFGDGLVLQNKRN